MSYHMMRGGIPPAPPAPALVAHSRQRRGRSRSRSRSRSPNRRGGSRYEDARNSRYVDDRRDPGRRKSRSPYSVKEEPSSSNMNASYGGPTHDLQGRASNQPHISRITPQDPNKSTIVRTILSPENVRIPRRENEGLRPIFERDELREGIQRRMQSGDNEQNPTHTDQRVVAIIREPMQQQFIQPVQEIIPILPQFMPEGMMQQIPHDRFETASGVSYTFPKRSRSHSTEHSRRDRGRGRHLGSPNRDRRERRIAPEQQRTPRRSSRSRTRSPSRVERVRIVNYNLRSVTPSHSSHAELGRNSYSGEDLRDSLIRHQLAKAQAENASPLLLEGLFCRRCNKSGHIQRNCTIWKRESGVKGGRVWTTTNCIHCGKMGHFSENCWHKGTGVKSMKKFGKGNVV